MLFVISTPIGNMEDITIRALKTLKQADLILAEDTRQTANLLNFHDISGKHLISYHDHNEMQRLPQIIGRLLNGQTIALVSNAGTPLVSDPGFRLVKEAIKQNIPVIPIPGPSAAISALSVSGISPAGFVFIGFPPKKEGKRITLLHRLKSIPQTLIFYESPKRTLEFLNEILSVLGDRDSVVAREMTKIHEEFIRGNLSEIIQDIAPRPFFKGEITIIIEGNTEKSEITSELRDIIKLKLTDYPGSPKELAKILSQQSGVSKNEIYTEIVKQKSQK